MRVIQWDSNNKEKYIKSLSNDYALGSMAGILSVLPHFNLNTTLK